jgi:putative peptide zinc metalloprotease protein
LVRRPDGQVIQISPLLYQVTCRIDGTRGTAAIAKLVSDDIGRSLTADQVRHLIAAKLLPLGIVTDRAPRPPRPGHALCSRSGHAARCCPNAPRTPRRYCCGRCSGGRRWWR